MKINIPNIEVQELLSDKRYQYLKYVTQILNLANQNAQGTRPRVVGQLSELIQNFEGSSLTEWETWYMSQNPAAIETATDRVWAMVQAFQRNIQDIDRDVVRQWVEELVIVKTFAGLKFQEAILKRVAREYMLPYRLATAEEESKGIDGFIGDQAVSIKPGSYKVKMGLREMIDIPIIFYEKKKDRIVVEFDLPDLG